MPSRGKNRSMRRNRSWRLLRDGCWFGRVRPAKRCNRGDEEIVPVFDGNTLDGFLNPLMVISQAPCFDFAHNLGPESRAFWPESFASVPQRVIWVKDRPKDFLTPGCDFFQEFESPSSDVASGGARLQRCGRPNRRRRTILRAGIDLMSLQKTLRNTRSVNPK